MINRILTAATILLVAVIIVSRETVGEAVGAVTDLVAVALPILFVLASVGVWLFYREWRQDRRANREMTLAEAELKRAEALRRLNDVATAPPGHQVYHVNFGADLAKGLHLSPQVHVNGHISRRPDDGELSRWQLYQVLHAPARKSIEAPPAIPGLTPGPPPLLDLIRDFERLLIYGPSKAGKTTLLQWLIDYRRQREQVLMVTPHADGTTPKEVTIGRGRDFEACAAVLDSLVWTMTERYDHVGREICDYADFESVTVFIDEWKAITKWAKREKRADVSENFSALLTEGRKVRIFIAIVSHSKRVRPLGLENEGDLKDSFLVVNLRYDQVKKSHLPAIVEIVGQDADIEATPPGPFPGYAAPREQFRLTEPPSAEERRIIEHLRRHPDDSNYAVCKAIWGKRNASRYDLIDRIRERYFGVTDA